MDSTIRLSYSGPPLSDEQAIQNLFVLTHVCIVRCVRTNSGYKVFVSNSKDLTPFLTTDGQRKLLAEGFKTITSPETKAQCTVVAKKLDRTVVAKTVEAIQEEISTQNGVTVLEVFKPPNSKLAKIRCSIPEDAQKLLKGFKVFNTSVPAYNVEPELYVHVNQCYKCYQYTHNKKDCPNTQVCSRCGEQGHFFTGCEKPVKCYNCGGEHTAVSGSCPLKKEQVKLARQENKSYANITKQQPLHSTTTPAPLRNHNTPQQTTQHTQQVNTNKNTTQQAQQASTNIIQPTNTPDNTNKITTCLHIAKQFANNNRKTFAKLIHEILQINNFDDVKIPETWLTNEPLNTDYPLIAANQPNKRPNTPKPTEQPKPQTKTKTQQASPTPTEQTQQTSPTPTEQTQQAQHSTTSNNNNTMATAHTTPKRKATSPDNQLSKRSARVLNRTILDHSHTESSSETSESTGLGEGAYSLPVPQVALVKDIPDWSVDPTSSDDDEKVARRKQRYRLPQTPYKLTYNINIEDSGS
ncbi:MAG: hypothetical protein AAGJ80_06755 [Cyanobacteria bacterium J06553_1]